MTIRAWVDYFDIHSSTRNALKRFGLCKDFAQTRRLATLSLVQSCAMSLRIANIVVQCTHNVFLCIPLLLADAGLASVVLHFSNICSFCRWFFSKRRDDYE